MFISVVLSFHALLNVEFDENYFFANITFLFHSLIQYVIVEIKVKEKSLCIKIH